MEVEKSRALRRANTENFVNKQLAIAKQAGRTVKQPGRLKKSHSADCGIPQCKICGNPRHGSNSRSAKTITELSSEEAFGKIELAALSGIETN